MTQYALTSASLRKSSQSLGRPGVGRTGSCKCRPKDRTLLRLGRRCLMDLAAVFLMIISSFMAAKSRQRLHSNALVVAGTR